MVSASRGGAAPLEDLGLSPALRGEGRGGAVCPFAGAWREPSWPSRPLSAPRGSSWGGWPWAPRGALGAGLVLAAYGGPGLALLLTGGLGHGAAEAAALGYLASPGNVARGGPGVLDPPLLSEEEEGLGPGGDRPPSFETAVPGGRSSRDGPCPLPAREGRPREGALPGLRAGVSVFLVRK